MKAVTVHKSSELTTLSNDSLLPEAEADGTSNAIREKADIAGDMGMTFFVWEADPPSPRVLPEVKPLGLLRFGGHLSRQTVSDDGKANGVRIHPKPDEAHIRECRCHLFLFRWASPVFAVVVDGPAFESVCGFAWDDNNAERNFSVP